MLLRVVFLKFIAGDSLDAFVKLGIATLVHDVALDNAHGKVPLVFGDLTGIGDLVLLLCVNIMLLSVEQLSERTVIQSFLIALIDDWLRVVLRLLLGVILGNQIAQLVYDFLSLLEQFHGVDLLLHVDSFVQRLLDLHQLAQVWIG